MSASAPSLETLLIRWRGLPQGDRKAIMRHLPAEQQAELAQALSRRRMEERADNGRYAAYSPWLAHILASSLEQADGSQPPLPPMVRDALREAHAKAEETRARREPPSLIGLARAALAARGLLP